MSWSPEYNCQHVKAGYAAGSDANGVREKGYDLEILFVKQFYSTI